MARRRNRREVVKVSTHFPTEAELCRQFTEFAREAGFKVWSETGYDLLLQATRFQAGGFDVRVGDYIGVEAKLTPNLKVLEQLGVRRYQSYYNGGPDFFMALVPRASDEFLYVASALRFLVCTSNLMWSNERMRRGTWAIDGGRQDRHLMAAPPWHPDIEVDIPAGQSAPKQLTAWKMKAVELAIHGRDQGALTSVDFHHYGVSMTVWKARGWIVPTGDRRGRIHVYRLGDKAPDTMYPEVTSAIRARLKEKGL